MPLQSTSGAASYDAFGGGTVAKVNYIEDFFQSYLRTGTGASATVTTGLDGSTKETLVWTKSRSAATNHKLTDNVRGATKALSSNTTSAEATDSQGLTAFSATGYTIGTNTDYNNSGATYVDWQWVSQPKFFDVVTYTGDGIAGKTISHNLGAVPGCMIVKCTSTANAWFVYHTSIGATKALILNATSSAQTGTGSWNDTAPTSTQFTVGDFAQVNTSGDTYVAYLFAHNAGGFGLTGTDNVISCGSYVGNGVAAGTIISLGYEPQFVLIKKSTSTASDWVIFDNMRGLTVSGVNDAYLRPNLSNAEASASWIEPNATGFQLTTTSPVVNENGATHIYIAIRRGPMKVPTSGTSVFTSITKTGASGGQTNTTDFPVDLSIDEGRATNYGATYYDRLRGAGPYLTSSSNVVETNQDPTYYIGFDSNTSVFNKNYGALGATYVNWLFRRAPSFMDVVCYSGDGSVSGSGTRSIPHNLNAVPQLIISKARNQVDAWRVYSETLGINSIVNLSNTAASTANTTNWGTPTSTNFLIKSDRNNSGFTYVTYLFSTCAGVSKVGSYTGTGTTLQIDCGFTGGARFVLIRRTSTGGGHWYIWDSARGIVSGNDPYVVINNIDPEVTNTDYIDTYSAGFEISSTAPAEINGSGGTFIFLAIA